MGINHTFFSRKQQRTFDYSYDPDSGSIICNEVHTGMSTWCSHIEEIMKEGGDSSVIWRKEIDAEYVDFKVLSIPIIPSLAEWEIVELVKVETAPMPTYRVTWDGNFIGFITRGEGRNVIRAMLFEWICSRPTIAEKCESSTHGLNEEIAYKRSPALIERWYISRHKMCSACFGNLMTSLSELAPDKESSGLWS